MLFLKRVNVQLLLIAAAAGASLTAAGKPAKGRHF